MEPQTNRGRAVHSPGMQIGTWNMAGRWSADHLTFVRDLDCDVLLLTEVDGGTTLPGYLMHHSQAEMTKGRWWAMVASRARLVALPDPHVASAMASIDGWTDRGRDRRRETGQGGCGWSPSVRPRRLHVENRVGPMNLVAGHS